jgi:hypothetical protein
MAKGRLSGSGGAGGGAGSRAVSKPTQYFTGQSAKGITPGHAASHGMAYGNHAT